MSGVEREFKLRIPSEEDLRALVVRLGGTSSTPVLQVNHFFDTEARVLRRARLALRLREEDGRFTLALKGPLLYGHPSLAIRPEEELEVGGATARAVLAGERSALELLETSSRAGSVLVDQALSLVASESLRHLGAFENERLRIGPLSFPPGSTGPPLVFELDRTRFPGGRIERELELELPAGASAPELETALNVLFFDVGIPVESVPSKAARFFLSLDSLPGRD